MLEELEHNSHGGPPELVHDAGSLLRKGLLVLALDGRVCVFRVKGSEALAHRVVRELLCRRCGY